MTSVGVVGLGYWGPNLARNFDRLPDAELTWLCDASEEALERWGRPSRRRAPPARSTSCSPTTRSTPWWWPRRCRPTRSSPRGCSKPGSTASSRSRWRRSAAEAEALVETARATDRILMVGHLLEYHPGVEKLSQLVSSGELGDVHYIYSNRLNLGKHRQDENALWSLGAHDVSVILRLAGEEPFQCDAVGESYVKPGVEDVVFALMRFHSGLVAHMHLSWLDPHKERRFTVVGSSGWPRSTTWSWNASSPSTTRASTRTTRRTVNTSPAQATSPRRGSRTRSRSGSSAPISSSASATARNRDRGPSPGCALCACWSSSNSLAESSSLAGR